MPDEPMPGAADASTTEAFLRKVLDASQNGLYVYDVDLGVHRFINARYTELTGYTLSDLQEMGREAFWARFHPEDLDTMAHHVAALLRIGDDRHLAVEYRFRRRTGEWIWCRSNDMVFERGADDRVRTIIGTFVDVTDHKEAERQLRRSESDTRRHLEEIELIYNCAPVGLCVLDSDLRFVRINERLAEINGLPVSAHLGRTVRQVLPELGERLEPALRRVLETGEAAIDVEIVGATPAQPGVERTWIESWLPMREDDGTVSGINIVAKEVTREREVQDALAASERRFRAILDNAGAGIAQVGLDGRFLRVNQRLCEITGYPAEELTRLRFQDITHPDDLGNDLQALQRLIDGAVPHYRIEKRYIRKNGESIWIKLTASATCRPDGTPEYFIAVIDDVSVRRAAEAHARTLATVVETSADFIGVAHLDGRAIYLNRAGQQLVGLDGDAAVLETRIQDYLFPEDLPFVEQTVLPQVLREGRWAGEFRFRHFVTGETIEVDWDVVRIDDQASGRPLRFATVTRDIRSQKAIEASLRESNRRKDEFLAVMGHELRNPMAPIRNAVEVLRLLVAGDDSRIEEMLGILDRQTRHMSRLLDDLLDISRIVRDKLKLDRRPVEVREIVEQAVDGVRPLIAERRHRLEVERPNPDLRVDGDSVRLTQILLNLLLNAAHYTGEGGTVQVRVGTEGEDVVVAVHDNGPGIPPDQLEQLFEPFVQGGRRDGGESTGLGLGLTISRRLAEMHGGRLEAESAWPQAGSTFRLYLPRLRHTPVGRLDGPPGDADTRRAGLSVLVVEDNRDVAQSLGMLLELLGYQVAIAESAEAALEACAERCPRVALVDIGLPDMDGLELARRLRQRYPGQDRLSLVALTGYGHDEAKARALEAGFDQHLAKPVDRRTLETVLDQAL